MAEIKMDLNEIVAIAVDVRSIQKQLENNFETITKAVEGISNIYDSEVIEEWIESYKKTKTIQRELIDAIGACSDYFENVNEIMEKVEESLKTGLADNMTNEWK